MTTPKASAIVSCYNERSRVLPVIEAAKKSKSLDEIIVVDDGSDTETKMILTGIRGIKLITHPVNRGKAEAMKSGLLASKNPVVVFVDADLTDFKPYHIDLMTSPVLSGQFDMVLGDREREMSYSRFLGFAITNSGERALLKSILTKNLKVFNVGGYQIENSINDLFFGKYRVARVTMSGVSQVWKIKKAGLRGFIADLNCIAKDIKLVGLKGFVNQLKFVHSLPDLSSPIPLTSKSFSSPPLGSHLPQWRSPSPEDSYSRLSIFHPARLVSWLRTYF